MATYSNIYIDQGSTYTSVIPVKDNNGLPLDLSDYSSRGQIRKSYSSNVKVPFTTSIASPLEGKVSLSLTASQTRAMKAGRYVYDVEIYNGSDDVIRIAEGQVEINPGISNSDVDIELPPIQTLSEIIDDRIDTRTVVVDRLLPLSAQDEARFYSNTKLVDRLALKAPLANPSFTGNVGIGIATPAEFNMHIVGDVDPAGLIVDAYGTAAPNFISRRARGSIGAPSAVQNGDGLCTYGARGYMTSGWSPFTRAAIVMHATENWTDTANGTRLSFAVTENGTTNRINRLVLNGDGTVNLSGRLELTTSSASDAIRITQTGAGNALVVQDSANPDTTPFVIDSIGNVGIGTASPATKLHIHDGVIRASRSDSANTQYIELSNNDASGGKLISYSAIDNAKPIAINATTNTSNTTATAGILGIAFQTYSIDRMRINEAGNVGIGTTTPGAKLNVVEANTSSATDTVRITNTGNGNSLVVEDSANPDTTPFVIDNIGRVLCGITSPIQIASNTFPGVQIASTATSNGAHLNISRFNSDVSEGWLSFAKSRNTTRSPGGIVESNDFLGTIVFSADDGTDLQSRSALITCKIDAGDTVAATAFVANKRYKILSIGSGTDWVAVGAPTGFTTGTIFTATGPGTGSGTATTEPSLDDTPGRLEFHTTPIGSNGPTERMRIDHRGNVRIGGGTPWTNVALQVVNAAGHASSTTATGLQVSQSLPTHITGDYHAFVASPSTAANTIIQTGTINGFLATANTAGADSRAKNAVGFHASGNLLRNPSENIFGFYSNIGSASFRIGDVARAAGESTITTVTNSNVLTAHGFVPGQLIAIAATTDPSFNGTFMVQSVPTNSSFTYTQTGAPDVTASGTLNNKGSATRTNNWNFYANGGSPNYFAGRTLFSGTTEFTTRIFGSNVTPRVQVLHNGNDAGYLAARFSNDGASARLSFAKSRGAIGAHTLVNAGDNLGIITFGGSDGTQIVEGAQIRSDVDSGVTVNATAIAAGKRYKIATPGNTVWTALGSANNNANTIFVATADGTSESGTGTATTEPDLNHMPTRMIFATTFSNTLTERMRIDSAGRIGIGTTAPSYQLELSIDSAAKPSTSAWTVSSDERLKENIEAADLDICYNAVKSIPLKRYKWKDEVYSPEQIADRSKIGWIAQDVQAVFPKAVGQHRFAYNQVKDEDGNIVSEDVIEDCLSLNADQLYATMYGAIQKLMNTVETLQARIDQLESSS